MIAFDAVAAAVEVVVSGGQWWARSSAGCIGVMQVCPRWSHVPAAWLWHPQVNRAEGDRLLRYWLQRSGGDWKLALAGYRCGNGGLRGRCGARYARAVLRLVRVLDSPTNTL